jgi:hypothetical protein
MNIKPFDNIEYVTLYHNTKYYQFVDNIHIKEIFNIENDILCVFYLDKVKNLFAEINFIDVLYSTKFTINNLIYATDLKYITINEKSNELIVYYIVLED